MFIETHKPKWQSIGRTALQCLINHDLTKIKTNLPNLLYSVSNDKLVENVYNVISDVFYSFVFNTVKPKLMNSDKPLEDFIIFWDFYKKAILAMTEALGCQSKFEEKAKRELRDLINLTRSFVIQHIFQDNIINNKMVNSLNAYTMNVRNGISSDVSLLGTFFATLFDCSYMYYRRFGIAILNRSSAYYRSLNESVFEQVNDIIVFAEQLEDIRETELKFKECFNFVIWEEQIDGIIAEKIVMPNISRLLQPPLQGLSIFMKTCNENALHLICKNIDAVTPMMESILDQINSEAAKQQDFLLFVKYLSIACRSISLKHFFSVFLTEQIQKCDKLPGGFARFLNNLVTNSTEMEIPDDYFCVTKYFSDDQERMFKRQCKKLLAKRLFKKPEILKEKFFIEKLKANDRFKVNKKDPELLEKFYKNNNYYIEMAKLIKDIEESVELMKDADKIEEISCQISCIHSKTKLAIDPCRLPHVLENAFEKFTQSYVAKYNGRKIQLDASRGSANLEAHFETNDKVYTTQLTVATYQLSVLLQFNEVKVWNFNELEDSTGIQNEKLKRVLDSLSSLDAPILICEENGTGTPTYSYNQNFVPKKNSISLLPKTRF